MDSERSCIALFSPSRYEVYDRCEQEAVYRYVDRLRARGAAKSPFFGNVLHAGLKTFYAGGTPEDVLGAAESYWGANQQAWAESDKPHLTLARARAILELYAESYPPEDWPFKVVYNEDRLASDEEQAILDRGVRWLGDGQVYAMDTKSTSMFIGRPWLERWKLNLQAVIQIERLEAALREPVAGIIIDGIYLSSRKDGPKREDFTRSSPFTYTRAMREELAGLRAVKRTRAKHLDLHPEEADKRFGSCMRYNSLCPFFDFCSADAADRKDMVELAIATGTFERGEAQA